eukprot:c23684_g1_i1 orf=1504-2241(-)
MYSDRLALNGTASRKRSVKDRLGGNVHNGDEQSRTKRFQGSDGNWRHDLYDDIDKPRLTTKGEQFSTQDLRFKLQKNMSREAQGGSNGSGGIKDLREKLSGPVPPPRPHSQKVAMPQQGSSTVARAGSTATNVPTVKPPSPAVKLPAPAVRPMAPAVKPPVPAVKPSVPTVKPPNASKMSIGAAGMTIASFLQSLDLSKYLITFQAEEIDMSILRVMKEDELKELGIPMGPRKKISLALAAQSKH